MDRPTPAGDGRIGIIRNDERQLTKGSELGFVRFAFAALAFAALTLFGGVGFADDAGRGAPIFDAGLVSAIFRITLGLAYLL